MSENLIKLTAMLAFFGASAMISAFRRMKRVRLIEETPRSKLAAAPQGLVEVEGFAWSRDDGTFANLNGQEAVYYVFTLQRKETKGSGKNKRTEWVTVFQFKHQKPFCLVDPTGLASIDPTHADFDIHHESTHSWSKLTSERRQRALKLIDGQIAGLPTSHSFLSKFLGSNYRVREQDIRVGSPIYVTGNFQSFGNQTTQISERGLTRFTQLVIDSGGRKLRNRDAILDVNQDGRVTSDEARVGYVQAASASRRATTSGTGEEISYEIFGQINATSEHKLFIADQHEAHLIAKLSCFNKLRIAGGAAALTAAVCLMLSPYVGDDVIPSLNPLKYQELEEAKRALATPERKMQYEQDAQELARLHRDCVENKYLSQCVHLLSRAEEWRLPEANRAYYQKVLCEKGVRDHCQANRLPAREGAF